MARTSNTLFRTTWLSAMLVSVTLLATGASAAPAPVVRGTPVVASTLSVAGKPVQWQRSNRNAWRPIARGSRHRVTFADAGLRLRACRVRPRICSRPTRVIPPAVRRVPTATGAVVTGATLRATRGEWAGANRYTYLWESSADGKSWRAAPGTNTALTYRVSDDTRRMRLRVTAINSGGSLAAFSGVLRPSASTPPPNPPPARAPTNIAPPSLSGTAQEGQTLSATAGIWSDTSATIARQWQRSQDGNTWVDLPGRTAGDYLVTADDVGQRLRVIETATTAGGSASTTSAASAVVLPAAPVADALPTISGDAAEGEALTASDGTWQRATALSRTWLRCGAGGSNCTDTAVSTAAYTLGAADAGSTLRLRVTASNVGGATTATSSASSVVIPLAPENVSLPTLPTTPRLGVPLTATTGAWQSALNPTYRYQWQMSVNGLTSWNDIAGATAASFTPARAEGSRYIRVRVTAENDGGSTAATSLASAQVEEAPDAITPPSITGTTTEGETLTVATGTWRATPGPITAEDITVQWQREDANTGEFDDIAGATDPDYVTVAGDRGRSLRAVVVATNAIGSTTETTLPTDLIAFVPTNASAPSIDHPTPGIGQTLTAYTGSWAAWPGITGFGYQWQSSANGTDWNDITGATGDTFAVTGDYEGDLLRVLVSATNLIGTAEPVASDATAAVAPQAIPGNITPPSVSDATPGVGQTISAEPGTWTSWPEITGYGYQWQTSADGTIWSDVTGATEEDFTVTSDESDLQLRVLVTATNSLGTSAPAESAATSAVAQPAIPANVVPPAVSDPAPVVGATLFADEGIWTDWPPIESFGYQWQISTDAGASWDDISGATGPFYEVIAGDTGATLRVQITATNALGASAPVDSPATDPVTAPE